MSAKSEQLEQKLEEVEASLSVSGEVCASCGIAAVDDVKLKDCNDGCDLVKYCGDGCQENHREQHVEECKKRLTDLHDKKLFEQPDISYMGECPLCCLPLPLDIMKSSFMTCCSKIICMGCNYASQKREFEQGLQQRCPFCREPAPESEEEVDKNIMERVKKNDPAAMVHMGKNHYNEGDCGKSFEYFTKAAELGEMAAHFCLGDMYYKGHGVDKDEKKAIHHYEQAAIGGHPSPRVLLANYEMDNDRFERAAKHYIIAANLGHDNSLDMIKQFFVQGIVSKEDYAAALRAHQAAVDATKSAQREAGEAFHEEFEKQLELGGTK